MNGRKKILLVSNGFYPEISPRSYRATELTKEFCRMGHAVTVISKFRDHDYSSFLKEFNLTFKMWPKLKLPFAPHFKSKILSQISWGISRILSIFFEYPAIAEMLLVRKILTCEEGYDLVISFAVPYPVHWGIAWSRSIKHPIANIWVADCGDPYMGDVLDTFRKPFYFSILEKWFCRKADFISIPIKSAISGYYPEFHYKIKIIPQGFDFDINGRNNNEPDNEDIEFAYAGGFLKGIRDPVPLVEFLIKYNKPFVFHVFTDQPDILKSYQEVLGDRLRISGYIAREKLILKLSKMDFLINFDNNTSLNVPSKLIDYTIAGRPVLNINKDFVREDLEAFLCKDYGKQMILPDLRQYHISNVSKLFLDLLDT